MVSRRFLKSLRCITAIIIAVFLIGCFLAIGNITKEETRKDDDFKRQQAIIKESLKMLAPKEVQESIRHEVAGLNQTDELIQNHFPIPELENKLPAVPGMRMPTPRVHSNHFNISALPPPNYNVHIFYYPWYGSPKYDGKFLHWNHDRLRHWDKKIGKKFSTKRHVPPDDIGASFYPKLGCYSSRDPSVIDEHMKQLRIAGTGEKSITKEIQILRLVLPK